MMHFTPFERESKLSITIWHSKRLIFVVSANTRAQTFLNDLAADKVSAADKYRRARRALLKLGLSTTDRVLRPLENTDLWMKNVSMPRHMGDDRVERSRSRDSKCSWSQHNACLSNRDVIGSGEVVP
jgi:hypothetical protein